LFCVLHVIHEPFGVTPAARLSAAIEVLDRWLAGQSAEQVLTNWGRASRYAGSGDRLAVRDLVFAAIRCRKSFGALGGAETGRGLILGGLRAQGIDPETFFTGEGHAPSLLTAADAPRTADALEALDCPEWLGAELQGALGQDFAAVMAALQSRAPVHLRVNLLKCNPIDAARALADDGIETRPHPLCDTALEVLTNPRRVAQSQAYQQGLVDLQDAASQAVVAALPLSNGQKVLDYCAGGGGKALAMAARLQGLVHAHDADPVRMRDLPARAARAGAKVRILPAADVAKTAPFDLVLLDVPCSGSGSWRRAPEGKWALTPDRLQALLVVQARILDDAAPLVARGGVLAYATCSMLRAENEAQVTAFLQRAQGWRALDSLRFSPLDGGDGFFAAMLMRE
jgi:16S rRNA (cytosine967-C5)-methyltransferase